MNATADGSAESIRASLTSTQQAARDRALHIRSTLRELWGDQLPPGEDAVITVLVDGVLVDDEAGSAVGLVVQSDGLAVEVLSEVVWGDGDGPARLARLPESLRNRLRAPS